MVIPVSFPPRSLSVIPVSPPNSVSPTSSVSFLSSSCANAFTTDDGIVAIKANARMKEIAMEQIVDSLLDLQKHNI
jgi:hypothetical protein